ncbi:MAG: hypothetical protein ACP5OC_03795 [Thermoplasmata archaeon]
MFNTSFLMNISYRPGQYLPSPPVRIQVSAFVTQSDDTAIADNGTHNLEFME